MDALTLCVHSLETKQPGTVPITPNWIDLVMRVGVDPDEEGGGDGNIARRKDNGELMDEKSEKNGGNTENNDNSNSNNANSKDADSGSDDGDGYSHQTGIQPTFTGGHRQNKES